ncbi:MAG: hypothetical protein AAB336_05855, partial [Acidobacteriota bacterium]
FTDLGNVYQKRNSKSRVDSKARNAFKGLENWQNENQMQLIKVLAKGHKKNDKKTGQIDYVKSKYELSFLMNLSKSYIPILTN